MLVHLLLTNTKQVYDASVLDALAHVTSRMLQHNPKTQCIFVSTQRNEHTFALFVKLCQSHGMVCEEIPNPIQTTCTTFPISTKHGPIKIQKLHL